MEDAQCGRSQVLYSKVAAGARPLSLAKLATDQPPPHRRHLVHQQHSICCLRHTQPTNPCHNVFAKTYSSLQYQLQSFGAPSYGTGTVKPRTYFTVWVGNSHAVK